MFVSKNTLLWSSLSRARARGLTASCGTAGLCFSGSSPKQTSRKDRENFLSGPSQKASLDLGSLTHSRRFAQCAPTHRETTQRRSDIMNTNAILTKLPTNEILHGDCIEAMRQMPSNSPTHRTW
jgi:hypothetical protein